MNDYSVGNKRSFVLVFLISILSTVTMFFLCSSVKINVSNEMNSQIKELFTVASSSFLPEPLERLRFIISVIGFPFLIAIFYLPTNKAVSKISNKTINKLFYICVLFSILILGFLLWVYGSQESNRFFVNGLFIFKQPINSFVAIVSIVVIYFLKKNSIIDFEKRHVNFFISFLIIGGLLLLSLTNVYSVYSITDSPIYTSHLNAVFHSVAAAYKGESLLVDFNNQYGLYPHFIEIIFRVIGLDVFKFTVVMSLLIFLCFYFLYKTLDRLVTSKAFVILGLALVIYYGFVHFKVYSGDPYFQYYPIRTLFPTLLIYYSVTFFKEQNKNKYHLLTMLFSMGVLWNLDTGIIVLISWVLVLIYDSALQEKSFGSFVRRSLNHVFTALICMGVVVIAFCVFIYLRSGQIPDIIGFFSYQIYFYGYGFFMLPMKLIHPWNIVALIYIVGLVISFLGLVNKSRTFISRIIFLLSVLGTGLFSYYQGRSHDHVLSLVWYPALILFVLFIYWLYEEYLTNIRTNVRRNYLLSFASVVTILFMVFTFIAFLGNFKELYNVMNERWSKITQKNETFVTRGLDFIKANTSTDEKVLILSYHSGIDYLSSNAKPFLGIPGTSELFLKEDYEKIFRTIENSSLDKVFLDKNFISDIQYNYEFNEKVLRLLYNKFEITDRSDSGNVLMLERKGTNNSQSELNGHLPEVGDSLHYYIYDNFFVANSRNEFIGMSEKLPKISLQQEFTIEIFVKPDGIQVPFAAIIGNHPGNGNQGFVIQQDNENQNIYSFSYGDGKDWITSSSIQLDPDKWTYLTVTYDHGNVVLYKDGVLQGQLENNLTLFENSEMPLSIGNWANQDRTFNGEIREVVISNEVMTYEAIAKRWEIVGAK